MTGGTCFMNCTNGSAFCSSHPGGMTACFADRSVRFIRQAISAATLAALVTADAGDMPRNNW